ncbi:MAG: STM4014 family protein [Myxococcota bacterium]
MSAPCVAVVGNPENRRVLSFVEAAERLGLPRPQVVPWRDVIRDPSVLAGLPAGGVRLESVGEDVEVAELLLDRGLAAARAWGCEVVEPGEGRRDFGRVLGPRQAHLGFLAVLDDLEAVLTERGDLTSLQPLDTIRACFDKNVTARVLESAGVPVARAIPCDTASDVLAAHQRERRPLWVKVTCASSASCLAVVRGAGPVHLMTTLHQGPSGRFNSLRLCRVGGDDVVPTLDWLLAEGARVEVDLPKARLDGAVFDLRVLVIRGEPRFLVVRQSRHPITNLHLGGWRGDPDALWRFLGPHGREALIEVCRGVGRALPHWHLGVDVLVGPDGTLAVLEVNAFGDLLPRLENAGLDTYGAEIAAILPHAGLPMLHSL